MHDSLNDQPARTGCKYENDGGLPVWQLRARARAPADSASQPRGSESWYQELSNAGSAAF
eukprot:COSAG05_NODE_2112_length_3547_cov_1.596288_1_plen_60_part_00